MRACVRRVHSEICICAGTNQNKINMGDTKLVRSAQPTAGKSISSKAAHMSALEFASLGPSSSSSSARGGSGLRAVISCSASAWATRAAMYGGSGMTGDMLLSTLCTAREPDPDPEPEPEDPDGFLTAKGTLKGLDLVWNLVPWP